MEVKRRLTAILLTVLLLLNVPFVCTFAEEEIAPDLEITAVPTPDSLTQPAEITLDFTLTNQTENTMESVTLTPSDSIVIHNLGTLEAGGSIAYSLNHDVTQDELNAGSISYLATCVVGSHHYSYPVDIPIAKIDAEPEVEFLRRVSGYSVTDGNSIAVAYIVRNIGTADIGNVTVSDALGDYSEQIDILNAGENHVFIQHISLSEDGISSPTLTYSAAASDEPYTVTLDELTLFAAEGGLDASITAGRSMFDPETSEVILRLNNTGTVDYLNLTVYDDIYGGVIADSIRIPAGGDAVEISHTYPLRGDSSYRWRVMGTTSAGDPVDFVTNTVSVYADDESGDPLLTLTAVPSATRISRRGYISVSLAVANIGDVMATDVQISEENEGEVYNLAVVPLGDATVCEVLLSIQESTTLTFSASYTDSYGQTRTATAEPIEITIGPGGQAPLTSDGSNSILGGLSTQIGNSSLFMGLLIGAIAIVIALIVILLVTSRRARVERKQRAAARKQRLKEDMAKTTRFKPIRVKPRNKK